jgi:hypothetical protein
VQSSCKLGNEPSGSIKCWELPNGCTTCGLSSSTQLHIVSYVHSVMSYGIIFSGSLTYSSLIFKIQKRIVRIVIKERNKESCHPLFWQLHILPLYSQYIFSLLLFAVKNLIMFNFNSDVHSINTRQVSHIFQPIN